MRRSFQNIFSLLLVFQIDCLSTHASHHDSLAIYQSVRYSLILSSLSSLFLPLTALLSLLLLFYFRLYPYIFSTKIDNFLVELPMRISELTALKELILRNNRCCIRVSVIIILIIEKIVIINNMGRLLLFGIVGCCYSYHY